MIKCKYCEKIINDEDQIIHCPDCMNIYHKTCIKERIINTETPMGVKKRFKSYYYKCPNCAKLINQN
ncbi:MAG: RING finger protein [Candidatus Odinarchaeota archaeon]